MPFFMFPLIRIFIDIALIRRGPDAIPRSSLFLLIACALWLMALLSGVLLSAPMYTMNRAVVEIFGAAVSIAVFALVVLARGRSERLLQTVTAIVGTSAIISFLMMLWVYAVPRSAGEPSPLNLVPLLLLLWAVQVKGHIIARACDYPLILGVVISLFVFFLRLSLDDFLEAIVA
jgi:hypothetical protein